MISITYGEEFIVYCIDQKLYTFVKKLVGDSYSLRPKLKMQDKASFDHILENYTGGHGKYQIIITILMTLLRLTNLHINFYQFTAYAPPHRCIVPSCEPSNRNKVKITICCLFVQKWLKIKSHKFVSIRGGGICSKLYVSVFN